MIHLIRKYKATWYRELFLDGKPALKQSCNRDRTNT